MLFYLFIKPLILHFWLKNIQASTWWCGHPSWSPPPASWHGADQSLEVGDVIHPLTPQLSDLPLELRQAGGGGVTQLLLHPAPSILNGIEIRAVAWPVNELDGRPLPEPGCQKKSARKSSAAYIGRQTKSFRLKTVKFRTKHPKTHSCPEKKTARRWDKQGGCNYNITTGQFLNRRLYNCRGFHLTLRMI